MSVTQGLGMELMRCLEVARSLSKYREKSQPAQRRMYVSVGATDRDSLLGELPRCLQVAGNPCSTGQQQHERVLEIFLAPRIV